MDILIVAVGRLSKVLRTIPDIAKFAFLGQQSLKNKNTHFDYKIYITSYKRNS